MWKALRALILHTKSIAKEIFKDSSTHRLATISYLLSHLSFSSVLIKQRQNKVNPIYLYYAPSIISYILSSYIFSLVCLFLSFFILLNCVSQTDFSLVAASKQYLVHEQTSYMFMPAAILYCYSLGSHFLKDTLRFILLSRNLNIFVDLHHTEFMNYTFKILKYTREKRKIIWMTRLYRIFIRKYLYRVSERCCAKTFHVSTNCKFVTQLVSCYMTLRFTRMAQQT